MIDYGCAGGAAGQPENMQAAFLRMAPGFSPSQIDPNALASNRLAIPSAATGHSAHAVGV